MSSAPLDATVGTLVLAGWANCFLLTLECMHLWRYYRQYPNDSFFNKASVAAAFVTDLVCCGGILSAVYLSCITNWGNLNYLTSTQPVGIAIYITSTGFTGAIVQCWLLARVYRLTRQWVWVALLSLPIVASLGGSLGGGILAASVTSSDRGSLIPLLTLWLLAAVVIDIAIALILVMALRKVKSEYSDTGNIINRIMISSVRNGALTATIAVISLVIFCLRPNDNISTMFESCIGRIYTMSMLANLNNRAQLAESGSSGGKAVNGAGFKATGKPSSRFGPGAFNQNEGVLIHRETETRVESSRGDEAQGRPYAPRDQHYDEASVDKLEFDSDTWDDRRNDHSAVELVKIGQE